MHVGGQQSGIQPSRTQWLPVSGHHSSEGIYRVLSIFLRIFAVQVRDVSSWKAHEDIVDGKFQEDCASTATGIQALTANRSHLQCPSALSVVLASNVYWKL